MVEVRVSAKMCMRVLYLILHKYQACSQTHTEGGSVLSGGMKSIKIGQVENTEMMKAEMKTNAKAILW